MGLIYSKFYEFLSRNISEEANLGYLMLIVIGFSCVLVVVFMK
jgi:hypothetical protein